MKVSSILFEHNYLPILHFENILHFEHENVYSPKCWGYGRTNDIDHLCKKQFSVKNQIESNNDVEAVIINNAKYNKYNDLEDVDKIICDYFSDAKVFDLRNKYNEVTYLSQVNNINNPQYIYDLYDDTVITNDLRSKKVIVFSSAEGDTTSLYSQLSLFAFIAKSDKKAVIVPSIKIISPNRNVINFDWSLYGRMPLKDFYLELKNFVKNIIYSDSDYIIIGVPQNVINVSQKCDSEIGVLQFILSQIIKIDALVVNIPNNGFAEDVLADIQEVLKNRYECNNAYIISSNILYQKSNDGNNPIYLNREKLKHCGAQNAVNCVNSFLLFDELDENVFSNKLVTDFF